jgi:hypothetical protein
MYAVAEKKENQTGWQLGNPIGISETHPCIDGELLQSRLLRKLMLDARHASSSCIVESGICESLDSMLEVDDGGCLIPHGSLELMSGIAHSDLDILTEHCRCFLHL